MSAQIRQSGLGMVAVMAAVAGVGFLTVFLTQITESSMFSHKRHLVDADRYVALQFLFRGSCDATLARAVADGIDCQSSTPSTIFLMDGDGNLVPPVYDKSDRTAQLYFLKVKTTCQDNKVTMWYARFESDGSQRTDRSVGLTGEWKEAFTGPLEDAQPFRGFPCP